MLIVKIGGPAYRIGLGGGAASSVPSGSREGGNAADLDFNAVQVRLRPGSASSSAEQHHSPAQCCHSLNDLLHNVSCSMSGRQ